MKNTHKARSARFWLCIALVICLISCIGASLVQTDFGKVTIRDLRFETASGPQMSALLLVPDTAPPDNPAPAIVCSHGWYNNREMQDLNYVEYARRGFVVLSIDMYGHGNSDNLETGTWWDESNNANGMYDAVQMVAGLPFVDKTRIGVTGHSNGALASRTAVLLDNEADEQLIAAALLVSNDAVYTDEDGAYFNMFGSRDAGIVACQYDEFFHRVKQEDGSYILNGTKVFITGGGRADTYVVFAMTDKSKGNKGISAFIVDKNDPGFSIGKIEHKMGIRGSQTAELIFEDVHLPADRLLGKENGGFKIAMMTLDGGRIGIASQALGIAQGALDKAIQYMKERVQFGKTLDKFQGLQWMVADMATKIDAARLLVRRAAFNKDHDLPYTKEAAMAKLFAAEVAMDVTTKCVQIYGGYGYIREYPMERMMRDAKITEIYEGTSQVQRMVIAGQVLR